MTVGILRFLQVINQHRYSNKSDPVLDMLHSLTEGFFSFSGIALLSLVLTASAARITILLLLLLERRPI